MHMVSMVMSRVICCATHCVELVGSNPTWQLQFLLHGQHFRLEPRLSMILRKPNPLFPALENNSNRPPDLFSSSRSRRKNYFSQLILISFSSALNSMSPVTSSAFLILASAAAK